MPRRSFLFVALLAALAPWVTPQHTAAEEVAIPFPSLPCNSNVPNPVEGIQIWDPTPERRVPYDGVVCVRIIEDGAPLNGSPVTITRSNSRKVAPGHSTGLDGVVSFIFNMRGGGTTRVDATGIYKGRPATATTYVTR